MPVPILRSRPDCERSRAFSASCSLEEEEGRLWRSPARSSDVVDALRMMDSSAEEEGSVSQLDTRRGPSRRFGARWTSSGGCGARCGCMRCWRFSREPERGMDGFMLTCAAPTLKNPFRSFKRFVVKELQGQPHPHMTAGMCVERKACLHPSPSSPLAAIEGNRRGSLDTWLGV